MALDDEVKQQPYRTEGRPVSAGMHEDFPPRLFLRDLKESSIGIVMNYWYHPPNYWDFLAFSEQVNLQIMEQLEAENIDFAAPALMVHTAEHQRAGLSAQSSPNAEQGKGKQG